MSVTDDDERSGTSTPAYGGEYFDFDEYIREEGLIEFRSLCGSPCWMTREGYERYLEMTRECELADQIELEGTPEEEFARMKEQGGVDRARKVLRKGSTWKVKHGLRKPVLYVDCNNLKHTWDRKVRHVRPHMTMHVRGGWQLALDDDGRPLPDETDWVAETEDRPVRKEVALVDIAKPAKPRRRRAKAGDFEVVQGSRAVIALDDEVSAPEPEEPWEYLDLDEDENSSRMTYAQVAATFA